MQRRGRIGTVYTDNQAVLGPFLAPFTMDGGPPGTIGEAAAAVVPIIQRFVHDRVDVESFGAADQPLVHRLVAGISAEYRAYLRQNNLLDFSSLEEALLDRLRNRRVPTLLADMAVVLVDEYQDTNALQEAIYFELVLATGASFTIVGDDDQSLYRFRGENSFETQLIDRAAIFAFWIAFEAFSPLHDSADHRSIVPNRDSASPLALALECKVFPMEP